MKYVYRPSGVCSRMFEFDIEDGVVKDVSIAGGCNGNLQGIRALIIGMPVGEVAQKLRGIHCGPKPTSCPDQIARALEQFQAENA